MISVKLLLNLGHSLTNAIRTLNGLEINNRGLIKVLELALMPVSLSVAKVLLFSTINDRYIILKVLQWQIQLEILLLLPSSR